MNIIVLSHMYPSKSHSYSGIFVKEQVQALKRITDGSITIISPVPWSPRFLWFRSKWRAYGKTETKNENGGIKVHYPRYLAVPGRSFMPLSGFFMYLCARGLIKKLLTESKGPTILHAHTVLPAGFAAVLLKKELNIKLVCTAHGSDINLYPLKSKLSYVLTKYVLQRTDAVVAVSEELKKKILSIFERKDVRVVTNGVTIEKIAGVDSNLSQNVFLRKNDICILYVGTLRFEKGVRELARAFKLLAKRYDHLRLVLVGYNAMPKWIESFIMKNRLEEAIELVGPVGHAAMQKYYSRASIFALPSYGEGMPTVMFEAMANRLPIVICKVGGVPEVIKDGVNGLLIEPRSEQQLYEKLKLLIEDEKVRNVLSDNAFADVTSKYTWDLNAVKMFDIYHQMFYNNSVFEE